MITMAQKTYSTKRKLTRETDNTKDGQKKPCIKKAKTKTKYPEDVQPISQYVASKIQNDASETAGSSNGVMVMSTTANGTQPFHLEKVVQDESIPKLPFVAGTSDGMSPSVTIVEHRSDENDEENLNSSDSIVENPTTAGSSTLSDESVKRILFEVPSFSDRLPASTPDTSQETQSAEKGKDQAEIADSSLPIEDSSESHESNSDYSTTSIVLESDIPNHTVTFKDLQVSGQVLGNQIVDLVCKFVDKRVVRELDSIQTGVNESITISTERRPLVGVGNIIPFDEFKNQYNTFTFPLPNCREFARFDTQLVADLHKIRSNLKEHIIATTSSGKDVKDSLRPIIKRFMSKCVVLSYTAQHDSTVYNDGSIISETEFFKCIRDAFFNIYNVEKVTVDETALLRAMGSVINFSRT